MAVTEGREAEIDAQLERLEEEERLVSARRRSLHDRMAIYPEQAERLGPKEREISQLRRELHRQIDELRVERSALHAE